MVVRRLRSGEGSLSTRLALLILFGISFGYVEAAVVYYLRALIRFHQDYSISHYRVWLNLGFIIFVQPAHTLLLTRRTADIEVGREFCTIVMLACVAYFAGRDVTQRFGAFLISFACWDISYYGWLRVMDGWPRSLLTRDVFFLIPVTWIGPVLTPLLICAGMLAGGIVLYLRASGSGRSRLYARRDARSRF